MNHIKISITPMAIIILILLLSFANGPLFAQCGGSGVNRGKKINKSNRNNSESTNHSSCNMKEHSNKDKENHDNANMHSTENHANISQDSKQGEFVKVTESLYQAMFSFHSLPEEQIQSLNKYQKEDYDKLMTQLHNLIEKMEEFNKEFKGQQKALETQ